MSKLSVTLHALPVLNISDYVTRSKLKGEKLLFGALFGIQSDKEVIVKNAFELKMMNGSDTDIDLQYLESKIQLYRTTFPDHDIIGWFQIRMDGTEIGSERPAQKSKSLAVTSTTAAFHKQIADLHDVSVVLVFNPKAESNLITSELPFKAYEPIFQGQSLIFEELKIRVDTEEAEKIGVDEIAKIDRTRSDQADASQVSSRWQAHSNAMEMFLERLKLLQDYVNGTRQGRYHKDFSVLREINAFMSRLNLQREVSLIDADNEQSLWVLTEVALALIYKGNLVMGDVQASTSTKKSIGIDGVPL